MLIGDLFERKVTREIPPVIYFHEQEPAELAREVGEYIITGGYDAKDARATEGGIHEQFVRLLSGMRKALGSEEARKLPASWISGFFGSGKSSFAKLLGLALDGRVLPDGKTLADALLEQDHSPNADALKQEWSLLLGAVTRPIACVFDVGSQARGDEHIHSVIVRQVQRRLGYSSQSQSVADMELALESEGRYQAFLAKVQEAHGKPWSELKDKPLAEDYCSAALHKLDTVTYSEPLSWLSSRDGLSRAFSADDAVRAIESMLDHRHPGGTLFIVIDEVSQYVHEDTDRTLALQSFVSDLGSRLKGKAWILCTGQQQLEAAATAGSALVKMKDRFPTALRVHLGTANIREVVHKRLLRKSKLPAEDLTALFRQHRPDIALHAYGGDDLTELDFVEVYPMLPKQIPLLLDITSGLRTQSDRAQTDVVAIRGLLQLLGDLFRLKKLDSYEVGQLVTLDLVYDLLATALDPDIQRTIDKGLDEAKRREDDWMMRALKAVAMLELVQDAKHKTSADLVARCLYEKLGVGDSLPHVQAALDALVGVGVVGQTESRGYRIESTAGRDWQNERDKHTVSVETQSEQIQAAIAQLVGSTDKVKLDGTDIPWLALYSEEAVNAKDLHLKDERKPTAMTVDFRFTKTKDAETWGPRSEATDLRNRVLWIVGDMDPVRLAASKFVRSDHMCTRYANKTSVSADKQRLAIDELNRRDVAQRDLVETVKTAFMEGTLYFRGRSESARRVDATFSRALSTFASGAARDLYPEPMLYAVTEKELLFLLESPLTAPPPVFGQERLGLLTLDAGRYELSCNGRVPTAVLAHLKELGTVTGSTLLSHFGGPPHGVSPEVIRAVVIGLLRAGKIRAEIPGEGEITSVREQGARELLKDGGLRKASFTINAGDKDDPGPRGRSRICTFFKEQLGKDVARENDAIADAATANLPRVRERLTEIETLLRRLPKSTVYPPALNQLQAALVKCSRDRKVEPTVNAIHSTLDALRDGVHLLRRMEADLTPDAARAVSEADDILRLLWPSLSAVGPSDAARSAAHAMSVHLKTERPWEDVAELEAHVAVIRDEARARRRAFLASHEAAVEQALDRTKRRSGVERLDDAQRFEVLQRLRDGAASRTDETAIAPALEALESQLARSRDDAERKAIAHLDALLEKTGVAPTVEVTVELTGREIVTTEDLERVLGDVRRQVMHEIAAKHRVRLRGV